MLVLLMPKIHYLRLAGELLLRESIAYSVYVKVIIRLDFDRCAV